MTKRLTKSNTNIVFSGSLAGIAEYFGIDPTVLRICYVVLSFVLTVFPGIIVYIALMILIPRNTQRDNRYQYGQSQDYNRNPYYGSGNQSRPRKEAEKVSEDRESKDDWSDF